MSVKVPLLVVTLCLTAGDSRDVYPPTYGVWVSYVTRGNREPVVCLCYQPTLGQAFVGYYRNVRGRGLKSCDVAVGYCWHDPFEPPCFMVQWIRERWDTDGLEFRHSVGTAVRTLSWRDVWGWVGQVFSPGRKTRAIQIKGSAEVHVCQAPHGRQEVGQGDEGRPQVHQEAAREEGQKEEVTFCLAPVPHDTVGCYVESWWTGRSDGVWEMRPRGSHDPTVYEVRPRQVFYYGRPVAKIQGPLHYNWAEVDILITGRVKEIRLYKRRP